MITLVYITYLLSGALFIKALLKFNRNNLEPLMIYTMLGYVFLSAAIYFTKELYEKM